MSQNGDNRNVIAFCRWEKIINYDRINNNMVNTRNTKSISVDIKEYII